MFGKFLKKLDIYGYPVGLHYRGDGTFTTALGGVMTLITLTLICINTVNLATQYFDHSAQTVQENTIQVDLSDQEPVFLDESKLHISVSHFDSIPPPEIGTWTAGILYSKNYTIQEPI